ncbi:hypothetical protein EYF80_005946 [Liparis tanakae]|uniref:Uncharacterized protein n=1 Tax=Liparis tanakae TaxID=230148 RepID=A0A4Z2J0G8_9TELE|nr:hypothetical protein EYF80_005946 [Liparis tanakae]
MLSPCWLKNSPTNEEPVLVVANRRMCFRPPVAASWRRFISAKAESNLPSEVEEPLCFSSMWEKPLGCRGVWGVCFKRFKAILR